jgi:phenylacetic acid degradation operon negative regulatory protein
MPPPLARIVQQLKREPSRTGSIVITVFGDAIVPRGGSVWLRMRSNSAVAQAASAQRF